MCKSSNGCITKMHCLHKSGSILVGDACWCDLKALYVHRTLDLNVLVGAEARYFSISLHIKIIFLLKKGYFQSYNANNDV